MKERSSSNVTNRFMKFAGMEETAAPRACSGIKAGKQASLRNEDKVLTTSFAIDAEANLLDWMDEQSVDGDASCRHLFAMESGAEGLLELMKWASPGQWEVWEGRAFLYLEIATGERAEDIHDLYTEERWTAALERLHGLSGDEFAERVVLDWMDRRKASEKRLTKRSTPKSCPPLRPTPGRPSR